MNDESGHQRKEFSLPHSETLQASEQEPSEVCTQYGALLSETMSREVLPDAFGRAAWQQYFGIDVGEEPQLPDDIEDILNSKAPFLLEDESTFQRVRDNHLLTLIPDKVDGEAFTLDKLGLLLLRNHDGRFAAFQSNNKESLDDYSHGYRYYSKYLTDATRQLPREGAPYWVLLPKTVLKNSRYGSFADQQAMVVQYSSHGYQLPRVLEVATSLLVHYARSGGERLYANTNKKGWWTYTRCSDIDKSGDPLVVGGFGASGLVVSYDYLVSQFGVACSRKL